MGVVKSVNPFALSIGMGINCGLAGLTFFGKSTLSTFSTSIQLHCLRIETDERQE